MLKEQWNVHFHVKLIWLLTSQHDTSSKKAIWWCKSNATSAKNNINQTHRAYLFFFFPNMAYNLSHLASLNWLRSLPCFCGLFLKVSFLRLLANWSIMVKNTNFHKFGKYLGKLFDGCLQLAFLAECKKGSLTALAWVYKLHSTCNFRQPTFGRGKKMLWAKKNQIYIFSDLHEYLTEGVFFPWYTTYKNTAALNPLSLISLWVLGRGKGQKERLWRVFSFRGQKPPLGMQHWKTALMQLPYRSKAYRILRYGLGWKGP